MFLEHSLSHDSFSVRNVPLFYLMSFSAYFLPEKFGDTEDSFNLGFLLLLFFFP